MAGKIPTFITGATAKIKVGGKTFAYAQDVQYGVNVDTIPIETMGRFEAVTNEPVNYSVGGSLSVVRYTKLASTAGMPGTNSSATSNGLGAVEFTTQGVASDHLNPGHLLLSKTWDLSVFQKTQANSESVEFITIKDCRFTRKTASINKRGILVDRLDFVGILADDDSFDASGSGDIDLS